MNEIPTDARVVARVLAVLGRFPTGLTPNQMADYVGALKTRPHLVPGLVRAGHVLEERRPGHGGVVRTYYRLPGGRES